MQPPDITRVFKGLQMEFEVEIVFGNEGNQSPEEAHDYDEIMDATKQNAEVDISDFVEKHCKKYEQPCLDFQFNAIDI